jgi:hypothetical protein
MKKYETKQLNLSASFILPLIDIPFVVLITNSRLYNTFLYDEEISQYRSNHIFVVHKNRQDLKFEEFEEILVNNKNFVNSYDIAASAYGVKVYKIPEEYLECHAVILAGGYSRIKEETKQKIISNNVANDKFVEKILRKDETLRIQIEEKLSAPGSPVFLNNQELWSKINLVKESLTKEKKQALLKSQLKPNGEFI